MCAAYEIARMYALNGTYVVTNSTACTLLVIYGGEVILDLDSTGGAGFLALAAGNASVGADLTDLGTLIVA